MRVIIFSILMFCYFNAESQRVMNLPEPFKAPVSYEDQESRDKFAINSGKGKKGEYWLVMSDRMGLPLLDKPDGIQIEKLDFREPAWVIGEKGEWIEIAVGRNDNGRMSKILKSGWIKKTDILLWPHCLRDANTSITKKAFLLNKVEEINRIIKDGDHSLVKIYDGPVSENVIATRGIYNVYFIFKEEKNRVLLGGVDFLTTVNVSNIIGWVDITRIEKWNQRLTLECNWDDEQYNIRQQNKNSRVYGFKDPIRASNYSKIGSLNESDILWDSDPAKPEYSRALRSRENENRPIGEVFRFPIFSKTTGFIESGAINQIPTKKVSDGTIGIISEEELVRYKSHFEKTLVPRRTNLNVAFLIEAKQNLNPYKPAILAAIESLDKQLPAHVNVRYSAGIYRDANLADKNNDFAFIRLTRDRDQVRNFINDQDFSDYTDPDNFTNQRYALSQIVEKAGFSADHTNLLIIIGSGADFYFDPGRNMSSSGSKYLIVDNKLNKLYSDLSKYDMNIAYLQVENKSGRAFTRFSHDARALLVIIAQQQYALYNSIIKNIPEAKINYPQMPDLDESNTSILYHGTGYGIIKRPDRNIRFEQSEIMRFTDQAVTATYERSEQAYSTLKKVVDGEGINASLIADSFSPLIWTFLKDLDTRSQSKVLDEKIKVYTKIYLPLKSQNAEPLYKMIVFMPFAELSAYIAELEALIRVLNSPPNEVREKLYDTFIELIKKMTGDQLRKSDHDRMTIDDVRMLLAGIEGEGFDFGEKLNVSILDIKNRRKFSNEDLMNLSEEIASKLQDLKAISQRGKSYPYAYTVNEAVYFWIDIDKLF